MDKTTLSLPKEQVAELGASKAQWALKRVHCANLSKDKRPYWEKLFSKWVMLPEPDNVVPDLDVLDALYMKHLPVSWDNIVVKLCECTPETFKAITGFDRKRNNLLEWVKWLGLLFNTCEAVVEQLVQYGFYVKQDSRKRGTVPALALGYMAFAGAYDPFDFGKAIVWMQTPDGPEERPFWWARAEKAFSGTPKDGAFNTLRDRMTLA